MTYLYVTPLQCRPKPEICRLRSVTCRPAQEHSRHEIVTDCRPEPPCVVTDIPKRAIVSIALYRKMQSFGATLEIDLHFSCLMG